MVLLDQIELNIGSVSQPVKVPPVIAVECTGLGPRSFSFSDNDYLKLSGIQSLNGQGLLQRIIIE